LCNYQQECRGQIIEMQDISRDISILRFCVKKKKKKEKNIRCHPFESSAVAVVNVCSSCNSALQFFRTQEGAIVPMYFLNCFTRERNCFNSHTPTFFNMLVLCPLNQTSIIGTLTETDVNIQCLKNGI